MIINTLARHETHIITFILAFSLIIFSSPSYAVNPDRFFRKNDDPTYNQVPSYMISPTVLTTESRFTSKVVKQEKIVPYQTVYKDNPDAEVGDDKVIQEGKTGQVETEITVTFYDGKEFERSITNVTRTDTVDKILSRGTKIVYRTINTPQGEITYYRKIRMWATSYHPYCSGCSGTGRTALGLKAGRGIVAVDPKVIKLGSRVYVPGYGMALAGDTGGAVKGNIIDLGFDSGDTNLWSARYSDVYLLP